MFLTRKYLVVSDKRERITDSYKKVLWNKIKTVQNKTFKTLSCLSPLKLSDSSCYFFSFRVQHSLWTSSATPAYLRKVHWFRTLSFSEVGLLKCLQHSVKRRQDFITSNFVADKISLFLNSILGVKRKTPKDDSNISFVQYPFVLVQSKKKQW